MYNRRARCGFIEINISYEPSHDQDRHMKFTHLVLSSKNLFKQYWRIVLLVVAISVQLFVLGKDYIFPWAYKIWLIRETPAIERSAIFSKDVTGSSEYIKFIRDVVPSERDAKVILPHKEIWGPFTHIGFMQYFLYPRLVDNCHKPIDKCVLNLMGEKTYILSVPGFPPHDVASQIKIYLPFDGEWGIFMPFTSKKE